MDKVSRVEKFKEYREEITLKYSGANDSAKKKASDHVNSVLNNENKQLELHNNENTISLDDILTTYSLYDKNNEEQVSPLLEKYKKERTIKIIGWVLCGVLSIALLVVGILYFGGK